MESVITKFVNDLRTNEGGGMRGTFIVNEEVGDTIIVNDNDVTITFPGIFRNVEDVHEVLGDTINRIRNILPDNAQIEYSINERAGEFRGPFDDDADDLTVIVRFGRNGANIYRNFRISRIGPDDYYVYAPNDETPANFTNDEYMGGDVYRFIDNVIHAEMLFADGANVVSYKTAEIVRARNTTETGFVISTFGPTVCETIIEAFIYIDADYGDAFDATVVKVS